MMSILFFIFIFLFVLSSLCESETLGVKIRKNVAFIVKDYLFILFILGVFIYYLIDLNIIDMQVYAMSDEAFGTIIDNAKNVNASTTVPTTPFTKSIVSVNAGVIVKNVQTEGINKLAENGKVIGEDLKVLGENLVGLGGGVEAVTGAKVGYGLGSTPLQKVGRAIAGAVLGQNIYANGVQTARLANRVNVPKYEPNSSSNTSTIASDSVSVSGNISGNITTEIDNSSVKFDYVKSFLDNLTNNDLINNSLLIINSPLEDEELTSQILSSILNSTLIINICNLILLIVMLTTFLQYLVVTNSLNIDYLDNLPLGQSIKKIVLKWKKFTSKSLLVYLFVWWLLLFISIFFSINHLQFIVTNFDSIVDLIISNK